MYHLNTDPPENAIALKMSKQENYHERLWLKDSRIIKTNLSKRKQRNLYFVI